MLIPQFSIRWLLAVTALCAVVFSVFGMALRGHTWAAAVSVVVLSLVVVVWVYALLFAVAWFASLVIPETVRGRSAGRSPFAAVEPAGEPIEATVVAESDGGSAASETGAP